MRTRLTDLLGIEVPLVLAPMGGAVGPELTAAVSNAGGVGVIPLSWSTPDELSARIGEIKSLTDKPFGVNLIREWDQRERLAAALDAGAPIVSLFWGESTDLVGEVKAGGAQAWVSVSSADEGARAAAAGADVVVAQGWEAGGHVRGTVSTLALVPRVVDAVDGVPVVAAGAIADGRGVAAALVLGAAGAWVGTRFLAAAEATIHDDYRRRILQAAETDTYYGTLFDRGWADAPHRALRNSTVEAWEAAGSPPSGSRPGEEDTPASRPDGTPVGRYASATPSAGMTGDTEPLSNWAGQGVGLVTRVQPAAEIVRELNDEAERVLAECA